MRILYNNQKLKTHIGGLDDLLFGGLHLQTVVQTNMVKPLNIVICGELGTSRSLLAMQMLHGITKSLYKLEDNAGNGIELDAPVFYTQDKSEENVSDMLVDTVLSQCIGKVIEANITEKTDDKGNEITWKGSLFCQTLFRVPPSTTLPIDLSSLDLYVANEILVYNSRTNSLHVGLPSTSVSYKSSDNPLIIERRHSTLGDFYYDMQYPIQRLGELSAEFFPVFVKSEKNIKKSGLFNHISGLGNKKIPCLVLDKKYEPSDVVIAEHALVVIYIENSGSDIDKYNADVIIEMRNYTDVRTNYLCNQLSIKKSVLQDTAHGWHQYKKRDYGIEVYPSTHVILQRRRHMPKGIQRAHAGILFETYQYFIDRQKDYNCVSSLSKYIDTYLQSSEECLRKNLDNLYENFSKSDCPEEILNDILVKESDCNSQITAIIGPTNSYKRYLALGGTFSACSHKEHTLHILLDKDDDLILKKMICPATIFKDPDSILQKKCVSCMECYKCIHFKEIRMGCISTDEFFYYLIQQLKVSLEMKDKSQRIRRIVLDDLQKIEFCFPMIDKDSLFLSGLISICKDYAIDLFILCDKSSEKVNALRSNADNVICTDRNSEYNLDIFVERYAGYSSPSHIWGCHVTNIKDLFCCDAESKDKKKYRLNEKNLRGFKVCSLEKYWRNGTGQ
ncbi:MAG: hypothetical protein KH897_15205 [Bacteroides sp.]|uniref:hypothetical protein n=1 Tax=Bacteroides sp. TaxID=29523 RepID=UPI0025B7DDF7|nr:hypothetical protein [Bacteroides sp.]MBS6239670.1 hypothetical protein [Bacteroides sp.]